MRFSAGRMRGCRTAACGVSGARLSGKKIIVPIIAMRLTIGRCQRRRDKIRGLDIRAPASRPPIAGPKINPSPSRRADLYRDAADRFSSVVISVTYAKAVEILPAIRPPNTRLTITIQSSSA